MKDIAKLYEELRSIIDGGSESFTHEDAVQYLKDKLAQPEQECICSQGQCCRVCDPDVANGFEQTEQEPVAWLHFHNRAEPQLDVQLEEPDCIKSFPDDVVWKKPLYTTPPQRKPLTKAQVLELWEQTYVQRGSTGIEFARAIEDAHGIKE